MYDIVTILLIVALFITLVLYKDAHDRAKNEHDLMVEAEEKMQVLAEQAGFSRMFQLEGEPGYDDTEGEWWTATPRLQRRIKIVSNGFPYGTHIYDGDTGKGIANCTYLRWECKAGEVPHLTMHLYAPAVQFDLPVEDQFTVKEVTRDDFSTTYSDDTFAGGS